MGDPTEVKKLEKEIENLDRAIDRIEDEILNLKDDLNGFRYERDDLTARLAELKNG